MIEVKNLTKTYYNSNSKHIALSSLNFKLGNSGVVFLYGNSGAGKSTLLNILCALDTYDKKGFVKYNGKDLKSMTQEERDKFRAEECGLIFEKDNLVSTLTVEENIKLARELKGLDTTEEELSNILKIVKLKGFEKRKISELSSGQAQRVALARVMLGNAKVLFVDEPTGHLDKQNAQTFWDIVKKQSKNSLVVAITHDKNIVEKYADRVLEIKDGEIVSDTYVSQELQIEDEKIFKFNKLDGYSVKKESHKPKTSTKIKLGTKVLGTNKFKMFSMVALITLTLIAFAIGYLLSAYNSNIVMAKSATIQNLEYVVFEKDNGAEITSTDIERLYRNNNNQVYYKVFEGDTDIKLGSLSNELFNASGFMILPQVASVTHNALKQEVVYGNYPSTTSKTNSIAISDYIATIMKIKGVNLRVSTAPQTYQYFKNMDIETLINKEVKIGEKYYTITAIYNTDFEKYIDVESGRILNVVDQSTFNYNLTNIYGMIHTTENGINKVIENVTEVSNVNLSFQNESTNKLLRTVGVTKFDNSLNYNIIGEKTTLSKGEVILPTYLFNDIFDVTLTNYQNDEEIVSAMSNSLLKIETVYNRVFNYTIVGVTNSNNLIFADGKDVDGGFREIVQSTMYPTLKLATTFESEKELASIIEMFDSFGFKYSSMYSGEIDDLSHFVSLFKVGLGVAITLIALFSMYFMFTFFATIIGNNKKTIGIYRCLGASFTTIITIYFVSCFILMLISLAASMLIGSALTAIINFALANSFGLPISILNINVLMFVYMGVLAISMAVVGSIIPILIYCDKTPAEVIKR